MTSFARFRILIAPAMMLAFAAGALVFAADYYVDGSNGDDSNSGMSAEDAWKTITHALEAATATEEDPATINVAVGIYSPSTNGEHFPLELKSNVRLCGISPWDTVLDAERNASGLITCESVYGVSVERVTLMGAYPPPSQAPMDSEARATAVLCDASSMTVRNCIIRNNASAKTEDAPAIRSNRSDLNVVSSEFLSNEAGPSFGPGGTRSPGAIRCESSSLGVSSSVFAGNTPGAIIAFESDVSVQSSRFCDNAAGVVLESYAGTLRVASSNFSDNQSQSILKCGGDLHLTSSFFTGNSRTLIECYLSDGWMTDCLFFDNTLMSTRTDRRYVMVLMDSSCVLDRCDISRNTTRGEEAIALSDDSDPACRDLRVVLRNCILSGNTLTAPALIQLGVYTQGPVRGSPASDPFVGVEACTIEGNTVLGLYQSSETTLLDVEDRYALVVNTMFHQNEADFFLNHGSADHDIHISHCCLQEEFEGEGNFVADPEFVSGPLGDYYLSCIDAGQDSDSPCIDAGSTSASIVGMDRLTTRTDNVLDSGIVDVGYHYSAVPPTIECEVGDGSDALGALPLDPGDRLVASVTLENGGAAMWVDLYAGFILPNGSVLCMMDGGFSPNLAPFMSPMLLPEGLPATDIDLFETLIPHGLPSGTYYFAAALSLTGEFRPIGDIAFASFAIGD